jgi:hypothetical protein
MAITTGYSVDCTNGSCSGGITKIYLANKQDIDTSVGTQGFTVGGTGEFTAVTMQALKVFFEVTPTRFTGEFREEGAANDNPCNYAFTQEVEFTISCNDLDARNFIDELKNQNCCGIVAIVERTDGTLWTIGYLTNQFMIMQTSSATSGKALTDSNQTVITLQAIAAEPAKIFTGVVPV